MKKNYLLIDTANVAIVGATASQERVSYQMVLETFISSLYRCKGIAKAPCEIVLALEGGASWRKGVNPYYKLKRAKQRDESKFDWQEFFKVLPSVLNTVEKNFKISMVRVSGAEGDDVLAVLAQEFAKESENKVLIISADKDLLQLQQNFKNIQQFSLNVNEYVTIENREYDFWEHVLRGDASDSIPNVLNPLEIFTTGKRQKALTSEKLTKIKEAILQGTVQDEFGIDIANRYQENLKMIDVNMIPSELKNEILTTYKTLPKSSASFQTELEFLRKIGKSSLLKF